MSDISIIVLGIAGAFLCYKIYKKKKKPEPMVCMLGADCHVVLKSNYSTIFGIGLEFYGLLYYSLIALSYAIILSIPSLQIPLLYFILWFISLCAFFFSLYLISLQAFIIKSWCTWCLTSALISTAIMLASTLSKN